MKSQEVFNRKDILAYFIVAGIGALLQLLIGSLLQEWFQLEYERALAVGYVSSFFIGFVLTKLFAFNAKNSSKTRREMVKYTLVSIVSGLITVYGSALARMILTNILPVDTYTIPYSVKEVHINKLLGHISGMGMSFVSNYILHKTFTFRNTGFYDRLKRLLGL
ncbi:GtrA family protein [Arsenicibacter rosenii]|uniref:Polysaccharide synthesis protein GtrA n=1 Tax=Arsenicibacter rosenii TaxID=1750698 RepID=A0A1S2VGV2_9BACT|nr:GtrA family protein [Arsenicibacter rosenii]OIN57475.1 polysaccharide synthesis protein GtrA [Arsenicibacter rosenii]